jgi:hypothetical protein
VIITAFDLATAAGVCDGAPGGKPRLWTWYLSDGGGSRPERLLHLARFLRKYFEQEPCDGVVYEKPIPLGMLNSHQPGPNMGPGFLAGGKGGRGKGFMLSEDNVAFARGAIGVLEMTCAEFGKPVEGLAVQDARQAVLGWRINSAKKSGEETKDRVVREVTQVFKIAAENDNECDAWVLHQFACARANPRTALQMTPLFGGALR